MKTGRIKITGARIDDGKRLGIRGAEMIVTAVDESGEIRLLPITTVITCAGRKEPVIATMTFRVAELDLDAEGRWIDDAKSEHFKGYGHCPCCGELSPPGTSRERSQTGSTTCGACACRTKSTRWVL